jgi:hypothetical protein
MQKLRMIFVSILVSVAAASSAYGELTFHLDFGQDGTYDDFWRLRKDEVISIDIYVSNVPEPGLISMGFILAYDDEAFGVVTPGQDTKVDGTNWPLNDLPKPPATGWLVMIGARLPEQGGLAGDNIRLGTVRFRTQKTDVSELVLLDREGTDDFVLEDTTVLDDQIPYPGGFVLATIHPAYRGDINWDGAVDLSDAILAFQTLAGIGPGNVYANGDVNQDHKIGLAEAIFILQKVAAARP